MRKYTLIVARRVPTEPTRALVGVVPVLEIFVNFRASIAAFSKDRAPFCRWEVVAIEIAAAERKQSETQTRKKENPNTVAVGSVVLTW